MPIAAVVVESYSPVRESELSISIGDTLEIISKNDDGWWLGDNGGNVGLFPSGCVAEIGEMQSLRVSRFSTSQVEGKVSEETLKRLADSSVSHPSEKAIAVEAFSGNSASELSFTEGEELNILDKTKEWWVGEKGGVVGQFPSSYVSLLPTSESSAIPNTVEKSQIPLSSEIRDKETKSSEPVSKDDQSIEKPIRKPTTLDIPFYTKPSYNTPTNTNQKSSVLNSDPNSTPTTPTTPATSEPTSDPVPNPLATDPPVVDPKPAPTSQPAPSHTELNPTPTVIPTTDAAPAPASATASDTVLTPISVADPTPSSTVISASSDTPSTAAPPIPEPRPVSPIQTPISPTGSFKVAKATATPRGDVPPERPYGPPPFTIRTTAHQFKLTRSATSNTIKSPVIGSRRAPSPPRRAPPSRTSSLFAISANNRLAQRNGSSTTIEPGSKSAISAAPAAPAAAPPIFSSPTSADSTQPLDIKQAQSEPMMAMWDYVAGSPTELTFKTGDIINVVEKNDDDGSWWQGESNGNFGHFPKNYVKPISNESQEPEEPFLLPLGTIGQVLYDYKPLTDTELPLTKGDEIVVLEKQMKGGWSKVSRNGKVGHVPSSYLHFTEEVYPPAKLASVGKGKALWPFEGKSDSELTFSKGDEISILKRLDGSWWLGELNGIVGHFPKTYVQDDQQSDTGVTPKQESTTSPTSSTTPISSTSSSISSTSSPSFSAASTASSSSNISPTSSSSPSLSSSSSSLSVASTAIGPTPLSPRQQNRIGFERGVTPSSPQESYVTMAQVKEMIEKATEPLHKEITRLKAILLEDRFAREALQAEVAQMRERV